ncbi:hypothetical protein EV641_106223 [Rhodococcus sp. SMB37]|uniref:hypothetical protein n=1 Tax=Rhodococcus sp. SMB37 TaxID=2512213 RepID=UPI0010483856|nr:hypothetical protein [Rhodococcus sp. SMB37]TCN53577.1 hypothetical protein EV641_106223 [Rhodococcus sp. SMB37]
MSSYSTSEAAEVTTATLVGRGLDPADYNISGIVRDGFSDAGGGRHSAFGMADEFDKAIAAHRR